MGRRTFLQCGGLCGAGLSGLGAVALAQASPGEPATGDAPESLTIRPYHLLCAVCSLGDEAQSATKQYERGRQLLDAVRRNPDIPVTLECSAGALYSYQESGTGEDTPESEEFNRKRDLDVLQIMGLPPGVTLPARALFKTLLMGISTPSGLCAYQTVTGAAWKGCPMAATGNYERGHDQGIEAIVPPRTEAEMAAEKTKSLEALYAAEEVPVRPHILVCAVCQYGEGLRPPYKEDNLPELIQLILTKKPGLTIKMARGADWMMCAPCPGRIPSLNSCSHVWGNGELDSQKRDLDLLQLLGLQFGSTMKARDLYALIFDRVTATHGVPDMCLKYNPQPSVWWDECAGQLYQANPRVKFVKGRRELMAKLKLTGDGEKHATT